MPNQPSEQCQICYNLGTGMSEVENGALITCDECAENMHDCSRCGEVWRANRVRQTATRGTFCVTCYDARFSFCNGCGCEINNRTDACIQDPQGGSLCGGCGVDTRNERQCARCENQTALENLLYNPRDERVCRTCYDAQTAECHDCGRLEMRNRMERRGERRFCNNCVNNGQWEHDGFHVPEPTYEVVGSPRKFGIELETHACANHNELRGNTAFGCKEEGSVDGMEFVSPVFYSDAGFEEVDKICTFARENEWELNSSCGFHVHLDMSNESNNSLNAVAIAYHYTYELWISFFSDSRKRNYYCAREDWDANDVLSSDSFEDFACCFAAERYRWLNLDSYRRFRTFEIRLHSGTLNATKIKNWTKAHLKFIDIMAAMSVQNITDNLANVSIAEQFEFISNLWNDDDLTAWLKGRAEHFGHPLTVVSNEELAI